jgi:hypothetical protein
LSGFLISSKLLLLIIITTAFSVNAHAAAQTSKSADYTDECIRLGISLENCSEQEVLKHRASHPPGTEVVDTKAETMKWWLVIGIIAAVLGGGASVFLIRSKMRSALERRRINRNSGQ